MGILTEVEEDQLADLSEEELEEGFSDTAADLTIATESIAQHVAVLETAMMAYEDYKDNRITADQLRYTIFAVENAAYGPAYIRPTLIIAEENIITSLLQSIGDLFKRIHFTIIKMVDGAQYGLKLFTVQRGNIRSLKNKLSSVGNEKITVKVGINKHLCFGEAGSIVRDANEYLSQYKLLASVMVPFLRETANLTEEDLFSSLKWYKEAIFGDLEDFFADRFNSLENTLGRAADEVKAHQVASTATFAEYKSPVLLGLADVLIRVPKKNTYKKGDFTSTYGAHRFFYMGIDRKTKVRFSTLFDGDAVFTLSKSDVMSLLTMAEEILDEAVELISYANRLSVFGADLEGDPFSKRKREEDFDYRGFYKTMQIYTRISSIISDSVSTGFVFGLNNVKQAVKVADKFVKKAS